MEEEDVSGIKTSRNKIVILAIILVVVIIIISSIYLINTKQLDEIDLTIVLTGNPQAWQGIAVSCVFQNVDDKIIGLEEPKLGDNFNIIIQTPEGTVIQYSGPVDATTPVYQQLLPGELSIWNYSIYANSTPWMNYDFPPGEYRIQSEYEPYSLFDNNNEISGLKKSNIIVLTLE